MGGMNLPTCPNLLCLAAGTVCSGPTWTLPDHFALGSAIPSWLPPAHTSANAPCSPSPQSHSGSVVVLAGSQALAKVLFFLHRQEEREDPDPSPCRAAGQDGTCPLEVFDLGRK